MVYHIPAGRNTLAMWLISMVSMAIYLMVSRDMGRTPFFKYHIYYTYDISWGQYCKAHKNSAADIRPALFLFLRICVIIKRGERKIQEYGTIYKIQPQGVL